MLPNNEGDLHYNQLAQSSFKREQELEQEIQKLKLEINKAFDEGYDKGWKEATKVGIHEAHKYQ